MIPPHMRLPKIIYNALALYDEAFRSQKLLDSSTFWEWVVIASAGDEVVQLDLTFLPTPNKSMKLFLTVLLSMSSLISCQRATSGEKEARSNFWSIPVATKQPEEKKIYPVAIIGAGAAGTMAVERTVLNNNEVLLFTGAKQEQRRSRGNWVRKVDNVPGLAKYERTILQLRNEVLDQLTHSPLSQNLYVIEDSVYSLQKKDDCFELIDGHDRIYYANYVILATGMMDEQPHIQGTIRPILKYSNGQTAAYCALCDGHRSFAKKTVVIGYSESAANVALLLSERYQSKHMTILTNGYSPAFTSDQLVKLQCRNIAIIETPIAKIVGDEQLKQLSGFILESGDTVDAEFCFVALGIRPNNQLALQVGARVDDKGLVITDSNGESSIDNLFVAGDLRANSLKQIYTAWQTAVESVQVINQRIRSSTSCTQ